MPKAKITFEVLSFWHAGSGESEGAYADRKVVRNSDGTPYLPGRTVKGLFREGVQLLEECGHAESGTTSRLFGTWTDEAVGRFETEPGSLRFTGAIIPGLSGKELAARLKEGLFETVASTKIDDHGLADDRTLRRVEVAVPLALEAVVDSDAPGAEWIAILGKAAPLIRHLGSHRHRGLGRVLVTVKEESR